MILNNVLSEVEVVDQQLSGAVDFSAIITDSRRAIPGGLFFAISGSRQDGNTYIEEAMARGCGCRNFRRTPWETFSD